MPASDFIAFAFTIPILMWHIRKMKKPSPIPSP
jgi:hypothetical protein